VSAFTVRGRPPKGLRTDAPLYVPGDKSISHRALLLAARAEGTSTITGLSDGEDVGRTRNAVVALGATIDDDAGRLRVSGGSMHPPAGIVDAGNSGTTMRLMAGYCAPFPWRTVLAGDTSLSSRPMDRVVTPLREMGAAITGRDGGRLAPLEIDGGDLHGIDYSLPVASAQVKGAVLLAGLGADGDTVVRERVRTRAHTEELLRLAGADITVSDDGLVVRVRASALRPFDLHVQGDPSQAAFWLVAAAIVPGSDVTVDDLYVGPARDGFLHVLRRMGADIAVDAAAGRVRARYGPLRPTTVGGGEVPALIDEIPALVVAAACAEGTSEFLGIGELRVKESDRIAAMADGLVRLGVEVSAGDDSLVVRGPADLEGARVDAHGDHRVAMALAVAGLAADGETTVDGWDAVAISYPAFAEDLQRCLS
jgi:3-phosphoshikimate 1-carboxyvinyltransferase